jgi:hypothetical protein
MWQVQARFMGWDDPVRLFFFGTRQIYLQLFPFPIRHIMSDGPQFLW